MGIYMQFLTKENPFWWKRGVDFFEMGEIADESIPAREKADCITER